MESLVRLRQLLEKTTAWGSPAWPYIIVFLAVAVVPFALAGIGGHLATLALPEDGKSRRRWKISIWIIALVGVGLFGLSQFMAYHADMDRQAKDDDFRNKVLASLPGLAREPSKAKREADVKALEETIKTAAPAPTQSIPNSSSPKPTSQAAAQPGSSAAPISTPVVAAPSPADISSTRCPLPGTLQTKQWVIGHNTRISRDNPATYYFASSILLDSFQSNPILSRLTGQGHMLDATEIQKSADLFADSFARLSKLAPIDTDSGPIRLNKTIEEIYRYFLHDADTVEVHFTVTTAGGNAWGNGVQIEKVAINSLPDRSRKFIAALDEISRQLTDSACSNYVKHLE